jgi:hypothetical protein
MKIIKEYEVDAFKNNLGYFTKLSPIFMRALDNQIDDINLSRDVSIFLSHLLQIENNRSTENEKYFVRMNMEMQVDPVSKKRLIAKTSFENSWQEDIGFSKKTMLKVRTAAIKLGLIEECKSSYCGRTGIWPNRNKIDALIKLQAKMEKEYKFGTNKQEPNLKSDTTSSEELKEAKENSIQVGRLHLEVDGNGVIKPSKNNEVDRQRYKKIFENYLDDEIKAAVDRIKEAGEIPQISLVLKNLKLNDTQKKQENFERKVSNAKFIEVSSSLGEKYIRNYPTNIGHL